MFEKTAKPSQSYAAANLRDGTERREAADIYDDGCVRIEHKSYYLTLKGAPLSLTKTQFLLASRLILNIGEIVKVRDLWEYAWGPDKPFKPKSIHVVASTLRRKLSPVGMRLDNVVGVGYILSHDKCCRSETALQVGRP